jgi:hypothetical protein
VELFEHMTPDERVEVHALLKAPYFAFQKRYLFLPQDFVRDCLVWNDGEAPLPYQLEIIGDVPTKQRASVRAPHGAGKTAQAAWLVHWFALTRDGWTDWKIPTTAGAWRQLEEYLWPEIHKWARRLRWDVIGRAPYTPHELLDMALNLSTGSAFAAASDQPELIEGAHASHLLYVFDESKAIPGATFDAAEGAFSQTGVEGKEALAFSISTPGPPTGRFYEIQRRAPGYEDWHTRHITLEEMIACNQITREFAEQRKRQWGEASAVYKNRILGEFASDDELGIIPLAWVEAAVDRWRKWVAQRAESTVPIRATYVGVDVARSGADRNTYAIRCEEPNLTVISELRRMTHTQDTMITAGQVLGITRALDVIPVVDVIGIGAGVVDRLREQSVTVLAFNASSKTDAKDSSGELGFVNLRAAGWWTLRERLDPGSDLKPLALPPDDILVGDLTTPRSRVQSGGSILVESKDEIKKRLDGRSTDSGDAVMMVMAAKLVPTKERGWEMF